MVVAEAAGKAPAAIATPFPEHTPTQLPACSNLSAGRFSFDKTKRA